MAYEKQVWLNGDIITEQKMNHIEQGIYQNGEVVIYEIDPYGNIMNAFSGLVQSILTRMATENSNNPACMETDITIEENDNTIEQLQLFIQKFLNGKTCYLKMFNGIVTITAASYNEDLGYYDLTFQYPLYPLIEDNRYNVSILIVYEGNESSNNNLILTVGITPITKYNNNATQSMI